MARKPAVQIICDRTGEAAIVQLGVTLENLNEQRGDDGAALELTFRPHEGDAITVKFDDLCERSDEMVKLLVGAIASSGYFMLVPLAGDGTEDVANEEPVEVAASTSTVAAEVPAPKKRGSRRTHAEIESDDLDAAVEAASSMVDKISKDPDAEELDVADARETLRDALKLRAYFGGLSEKAKKRYASDARAVRKSGGQPPRPANLPDIDDDELQRYGLVDHVVGEDHPDATIDDDDIFEVTPADTDEPDPDPEDFL